MKKIIVSFTTTFAVIALASSFVIPLTVNAQQIATCPAGYVCTPVQQPTSATSTATASVVGTPVTAPSTVLTASCIGTVQQIYTGDSSLVTGIVWQASVSGGSGSYSFHWILDNTDSSALKFYDWRVSQSYNTVGIKRALVHVNDGYNTFDAGCSVLINKIKTTSIPVISTTTLLFKAHSIAASLEANSYVLTNKTFNITKDSSTKYYLAGSSDIATPFMVDDYVYVNSKYFKTGDYTYVGGHQIGQPIQVAYNTGGSKVLDVTDAIVDGDNTFGITDNGGFGYGWSDIYLVVVKSSSVAKSTQPSITVLSPNGGESYVNYAGVGLTNSIINVKYSSTGIVGSPITAYLYSPVYGNIRSISAIADANDSAYLDFQLPKGDIVNSGQYKVTICSDVQTSGKSLCDSSDNYFTISSSDPVTPSPLALNLSLDPYSPATSTVVISNVAQTKNVPLAIFDINSPNSPAYLKNINFNISTNGVVVSSLLPNLMISIGNQAYPVTTVVPVSSSSETAFFTGLNVSIPVNVNVPIILSGDVAVDTGSLSGSTVVASLMATSSTVNALDQNNSTMPVNPTIVNGNSITFMSTSTIPGLIAPTVSNLNAVAFPPVSIANGPSTQQFSFSAAITAGTSPVSVSKDITKAFTTATIPTLNNDGSISLLSWTDNDQTNDTSQYFYIAPGQSKTFTASYIVKAVASISGLYKVTSLNVSLLYTQSAYTFNSSDLQNTLVFTFNLVGSGTLPPVTPPSPSVSISASPTSVTSGGGSTLTWSSNNATSCTASGNWSGSKATSGSQKITNITSTSTNTLTCTGNGGSSSATVYILVTPYKPPTPTLKSTDLDLSMKFPFVSTPVCPKKPTTRTYNISPFPYDVSVTAKTDVIGNDNLQINGTQIGTTYNNVYCGDGRVVMNSLPVGSSIMTIPAHRPITITNTDTVGLGTSATGILTFTEIKGTASSLDFSNQTASVLDAFVNLLSGLFFR